MTSSLNVMPQSHDVKSGVERPEAVSKALGSALADTYRLVFKTHAYHWNVEGPLFYSIHNLTETQYNDMFKAADVLAERIRALGQVAPFNLSEIMSASVIEDKAELPSAGEMCRDLSEDHERMAHRLRGLIKIAGEHEDPVTEDLATERAAFHEQAAWMLRAIYAD